MAVIVMAILLLPEYLRAQHPTEAGAQYVATFTGEADILSTADVKSGYETTVWLVGGNYDYVLRLSSLEFSGTGTCIALNSVPLDDIVRDVTRAAVKKGVLLGYPGCSTSAFSATVRVWTEACGLRTGSGCGTTFAPCGTAWVYRGYDVDCPGTGAAAIEEAGGTYSTCSGQCEGTHNETGLE